MSHPDGAYLGGIRTLEDLRGRCFIDSDTQCWHWRLAMSQGSPRVHVRCPDGKSVVMRGRRAALFLSLGADAHVGQYAWNRAHCHSPDCVNPGHAKHGSRKQWGADMRKRGTFTNLPSKVRAARATSAARRKLTDEQAAAVLASTDSIAVTAARFGVSRIVVVGIRNRTTYLPREMAGASVFSWGGV
jgi:hypothetical protein